MFIKNKLPLILQSELAECGLACLAMILGYYHCQCSLSDIRQKTQLSLKGITLFQLKNIAMTLGFVANVLRIDLAQFKTINLPCIIHWNMNHFVVLKKIHKTHFIIHDPARGVRKISFSDIERYFTGIVLELQPTDKLYVNKHTINKKYLSTLFKKYKFDFIQLITISLLIQILYIIGIKIIQTCIDNSINLSHLSFSFYLIIILFGVKLIEVSTKAIRSLIITFAGNKINYDIAFTIKKHLMSLSVSFFENRHVGDVLSRFGGIEKIRSITTEGLVETIVDGLISIIILLAMCLCNLQMTFITLGFSSVICSIRFFYNKKIKQLHEEALSAKSQEISYFMETIRAIPSLKVFGKSEMRRKIWLNKFIRSTNKATRIVWHKTFHKMLNNLFNSIDLVFSVALGCAFLNKQIITIGILYAFLSFRSQFISSLNNLLEKSQDLKLFHLHFERLNDILLEPLEIQHSGCAYFHPINFVSHSDLILENISFSYSADEKPIIKTLDLIIKKYECVAITGSSGCGKTTLLKIMMGFLAPTQGNIYINHIPVYPSHILCYRSRIAGVLQNDALFSGSIADNICFFDKDRDVERIYACARLASIMDEINDFPMRFNTLIGDMGSVLSGGQKQRILLARALYSQPAILFLDEATSHLDSYNEYEVNQAIRSLGMTVIMVAHRKETIAMADRVVTLN